MKEAAADPRIGMLKGSLMCCVCELLGLLPVIGLPSALAALWNSHRIRIREKQFWNAARPYRIGGALCAAVGTVFWSFVLMLILCNMATGDVAGGPFLMSGDE